jgi:hypothetical protein
MPADRFAATHRPTEYDEDWDGMLSRETFSSSYDHPALVADLKANGMLEPVGVSRGGWVEDGHHRVVAALDAGIPVRYTRVPREHDEDYY